MLRAKDLGIVALDTKTTSVDPMTQMCGVSLAVGDNEACYVPIGHRDGDSQGGNDIRAGSPVCPDQIPRRPRSKLFARCWKIRAFSRSART